MSRSARPVTVLSIIRDCLDALLHPSARSDALMRARHRAFMAPRLLGSLGAFAAFPIYLAMRGAPSAVEVAAFAWLIAPILLSWFLSRTGRYEGAHVLSSLALAGLIMAVAGSTGGIESFAAVWLVVVPLEAALSASRRVAAFASLLALSCAGLLILLGQLGWLPSADISAAERGALMACGVVSATLYAAGLAFGAQSLARTSVALLSREEERYRLLARNMSDVISRHQRNGAVQFISPAAEAMLGLPVAQLLGHGLFDRVHVADRPAYLTALSDAARGEVRSVEFRLRREADGAERGQVDFLWVQMRCRPLDQDMGHNSDRDVAREAEVVAVMRDITDHKLSEQALEQARSAAEAADAAKTRFLATMSHELRTPLNAIIGFSEMIAQEQALMLGAAQRREYAQLINDSGQHLLSVVNGILDMSKMESGNFEIASEPFAPRASLLHCCNLLALKARENGIDLITDAPHDLPVMTGDPRAFKQIVLNLVANAIKFTERGGQVSVSAAVTGSQLMLRINDTGVGIAPDDLQRIGAPFFQAGKTYQRRHEGTGLGLSIVKSLVALHLGELTVQSRLGEGTAVTVKLPLVYTPPQARPAESKIATLTPALRQEFQGQEFQGQELQGQELQDQARDQSQDQPALVKKSA
ncbi:PAS domain-containing sensor histidine kinase [Bradyrhizobium sp. WBOS7]|uniref:histidine kinase n=1 Tax=Bradyrhizobium betae TaxID=244734 RepID=A0AAE9NBY0_9BRAD|nr:PAS domain-containing sensor histidine kinase [Bradyrhizobium sp. WBOS2]MDD1572007.1 PAS domain-containing sensor histidine kinase [Bradyrhizobium sp. WBOS1]MDD1575511.1 PAS domain-containing sensor histidine kinase [Bradyrhizobium sp. WBOS7]MDD1600974.1 PAS domain-containing sensor histidine kinase [Bradyrhizobium sp. WBOS16]UUO36077.1 PAS domain-containing sensor histidine kinase [Bradyrhizobium sp. WBOS01]UUO42382.1 PAS domain-containing sensor histidine kinase [Bradyrhizobium sp. WBOS02